jgi:GT2 family glycosyltransferase
MVSVIVSLCNQAHLARRFLESLLRNSGRVEEVWVVDNGSTDGTAAMLEEYAPKFKEWRIRFGILRNESNVGFGRACNQAIRQATGDWIAVMSDDIWLMPNWDVELIRDAEARRLDLIGPHFDERPWNDEVELRAQEFLRWNSGRFRKRFVPVLLFFGGPALERLKLDHGGIFDERGLDAHEWTDLRLRMERAGMRYGQTSNCYIWHSSSGTRSDPDDSPGGKEREALRLFVEKWGFDPHKAENTLWQRLRRRYREFQAARGKF